MGSLDAQPKAKILSPEGPHASMIFKIVDLGTKMDSYQGDPPEPKHSIYVGWELLDTKMDDGRPFSIGKEYTVTPSSYEEGTFYFAESSNINKLLQKVTGKGSKECRPTWTLTNLLRDNVVMTMVVEHVESRKEKGKFYDAIESVKPFKGKEKYVPVNPRLVLSLEDENPPDLPSWMVARRAECLEFNGGVPERKKTPKPLDTSDEDAPF